VLGTGGLAPLVSGESETIAEFVPDLTLLGLRLTYLRNAAGSVPLVSSVAMPAPRRSPAAARTSPTTSPGESRDTP
jgi:type III pantothenate kinase